MIQDKLRLTPPQNARIMGENGRQIDRFLYHRALSDAARHQIYAEAESALLFRYDDRLNNGSGVWQGEFWGKWMLSAVLAAEYTRSQELTEFIRNAALRVAATANADGYIGSYHNPDIMLENKSAEVWSEGCNWSVWCRKYTMWGLLEAYRLTGEKAALDAARGMADHLMASLNKQNLTLGQTGCVVGFASCSILKPVLLLYQYTNLPRYLAFAREICDAWEQDPATPPSILYHALRGEPVHTWYPHPQQWAKAYEMTSCLEGIAEMYRVTGEEKYLRTVVTLWDLLRKYEKNALRSVGFIDKFNRGAHRVNVMSEPCDAFHWCRLSLALLRITGEAKYAAEYADTFYNAVMASTNPEGTWGPCRMRSSYRHIFAWEQSEFYMNHCCVNNLPRAFVDTACYAVMQNMSGSEIYVHLYDAGQYHLEDAQGNPICVTIRGHFLDTGKATVAVDVSGNNPVNVRLLFPQWGPGTKVMRNGAALSGAIPGQYLDAQADARSVTEFAFDFDMNPRLVVAPVAGESLPAGELQALMEDPEVLETGEKFVHFGAEHEIPEKAAYSTPRYSVFWGPLLLARDIRLGCTQEELFGDPEFPEGGTCEIVPEGKRPGFHHIYRVTITDRQNHSKTLRMCDFSSAGQTYDPETSAFSIYL
ncbi:MAG: glycoside hydrolase family 127 protein [Eubacteriales bacterium]|nr:glycoside hydrolase family 127 protein [Eubacteriales bacterium]